MTFLSSYYFFIRLPHEILIDSIMSTVYHSNTPIGEIVANDYRTATVFSSAGIDFCCGGKKSLGETCAEKGISVEDITAELTEATATPVSYAQNFKAWNLDFLCDYIVNTHHKYVIESLPELKFYTRKIADVHGENHPELLKVADLFSQVDAELRQHLGHEEEDLFPAIKRMLSNPNETDRGTIRSEIDRMHGEHDFAGGAMDTINEITNGYDVPADGCNTYQVAFRLLKEFEDDLHTHVHLENNILFPKAYTL
ncbi:iron-sulfur cluster repair di-iron protein [Bacteroidales bacterium 6E]|nr:iron-sulfur cluster repair di-iron protein [Bacteroidales bacterium 6E]